ncbi:MAG: SHOCT domain-containing protein [Alphaproteobacteria bacterium]|nr:SHOCT domain-containing protein [Alphaproteobacteria bacterium]
MMGWGGWWFGPVMMLVVLAVLVLAIIGLWRLFSGPRSASGGSDASLEILRERFARGEIDEQEFEARKKALTR